MKPTIILISLMLGLAFFSSCKKDPVQKPPPAQQPSAEFVIRLHDTYLPASKVDSAFATWEVGGNKQEIKLTLQGNQLTTDLKKLTEGIGKLTLRIYSNIKFANQYPAQWILEKDMMIDHDNTSVFSGPGNFHDLLWSPRVMLKDGTGHSAVVALRPDDPYFFVKNIPDDVVKVVVYRGYWNTIGGVRNVGGDEWQCTAGCTNNNGDIENNQFFSFLPSQIGAKSWNHIEIVVLYEEAGGWASALDLNHTLN